MKNTYQFSDNSRPSPHTSPILDWLAAEQQPDPSPACKSCPAAIWYSTQGELKAYCKQMALISWDSTAAPVLACDGRELAIAELEGRNQRRAERAAQQQAAQAAREVERQAKRLERAEREAKRQAKELEREARRAEREAKRLAAAQESQTQQS